MRKSLLATLGIASLVLAGCSSADNGETTTTDAAANKSIVASTSIWSSVAAASAGDGWSVDAIVSGSAVDPHSFEPTAGDIAQAMKANLVVVGGGGYDSWLYTPVSKDGHEDSIIHALPLTEHHHHDEDGDDHDEEHGDEHSESENHDEHSDHEEHDHGVNEHIWYDADAVSQVAEDVAKHTDGDASTVVNRMKDVKERLSKLPAVKVAQTETIADYLVEDSSLEDITPEGYHHAMMNHSTPAAADLADFLDVIDQVDVLLYNPQTETDQSKRIHDAAEKAGVKIVEVGEIPPTGEDFLDYFESVVSALEEATR